MRTLAVDIDDGIRERGAPAVRSARTALRNWTRLSRPVSASCSIWNWQATAPSCTPSDRVITLRRGAGSRSCSLQRAGACLGSRRTSTNRRPRPPEGTALLVKTLFLSPPSFDGFDGGAGARYQAKREVTSFWYPTWLAQPAALMPGSTLVDAAPHGLSTEDVLKIAVGHDLVIMHTSTAVAAQRRRVRAAHQGTESERQGRFHRRARRGVARTRRSRRIR